MNPGRRSELRRGQVGNNHWLSVTRPVPAHLRPFVSGYAGYEERTPAPFRRRELPHPQVVLIFEFAPALTLYPRADLELPQRFAHGFIAGVHERATLTAHEGRQTGLQLDLTPIGAHRLLGLPMSEIAGRVVGLDELPVRELHGLSARLAELRGWDARFDLLEAVLERRLPALGPRDLRVTRACARIRASHGQVDIASLARAAGCSHRHLIALFRRQIGVSPKQLARLARFDALVDHLRRGNSSPSWAALAVDFGYCDQSHLSREIKRLTGLPPSRLPALVHPFGETKRGETIG